MNIKEIIKDDKNKSKNNLLYGEGFKISAATLEGVKNQTELFPFKDWRFDFRDGLREMRIDDTSKIQRFTNEFNLISERYNGQLQLIPVSEEYEKLVNKIRRDGVDRRWDYEKYLIDNSKISKYNNVLGAIESSGEKRYWTIEEMEMISQGDRPSAEANEILGNKRITYEGAHGKSMSIMDTGDITSMYDPNNVAPYSPKGHLKVSHKGNFGNTSNETITNITDTTNELEEKQRIILDKEENADLAAGLALGLIAGSISAIIKFRKLSRNQKPWNVKMTTQVLGAFIKGSSVVGLPFMIVQEIDNPVRDMIDSMVSMYISDGSALPIDSFADNMADTLGDFSIIITAIAVSRVVSSVYNNKNRGYDEFGKNIINELKRPLIEQIGFAAFDLVLDNATSIPDPQINAIVTAARITYSIGKIGGNIKSRKNLHEYKLKCIYDASVAAAVGLK